MAMIDVDWLNSCSMAACVRFGECSEVTTLRVKWYEGSGTTHKENWKGREWSVEISCLEGTDVTVPYVETRDVDKK